MEFDNANFEKNIKVTSDTLKKFNKELEFKDAGKNFSNVEKSVSSFSKKADTEIGNVKKGVSTLQSTISKFTWEPMTAGIESVKLKFSAMQVAAATAVSKITNSVMDAGTKLKNSAWGQITSGGSSRATNIENAKFKIGNLVRDNTKGKTAAEQAQIDAKNTKKAAETWKQAYEDMDYAVSGTAYGIDAAASAASQLMASNVKLGDEMKYSLRAISGVAAMTGSTYEDISAIFTSAAGKGKVQADELNRIATRGLNVTATLADKLGTTEETVREMAKNGEIDFKTFAKAMDEAFGDSATRANDTFQGAMSNVKAALSRIGEPFYTVAHENLRLSFVELIPVINKFKSAIAAKDSKGNIKKDSIVGVFTQATDFLREKFIGTMNRIKGDNTIETYIGNIGKALNRNLGNFKSIVNNSISIFKNIKDTVSHFITPLHDAFISIFPSKNELGFITSAVNMVKIVIEDFTQAIKDAIHNKDVKGNYESNKLTTFFKGIFSVVRIAWKGLSFFVKTARKASNIITPILSIIATGFEKIGEGLLWITDKIEKSEKIRIFLDFLSRAAGSLKDNISGAIKAASPFTKWIKDTYTLIKTKLEPVFKSARKAVSGFTDGIFKAMDSAFRNTSGILITASAAAKDAKDGIKKTTGEVKDAISSTGDSSFLSSVWNGISWFFERVSEGFSKVKKAFVGSEDGNGIWDRIKTIFSKIGEIFSLIWSKVSPQIKKVAKTITDSSSSGLDAIIEYLKTHDITGFIEKVAKIFLTGATAKFLWKFSDAGIFKSVSGGFEGIGKMFGSVSEVMNSLSRKISAPKPGKVKEMLKTIAEVLKALALVIVSITASLFLLSFVDQNKLNSAADSLKGIIIWIGVIISVVAFAASEMDNKNTSSILKFDKKNGLSMNSNKSIFDAIAAMITAIGAGVLMIAVAAKVMSMIDKNRFGGVIINIYAILGVLTAMMAALISLPKVLDLKDKELENIPKIIDSFSKLLKSISKVFIKMALVVVLLGKTMTAGQLIKGVLALGAMAAIIAMLMYAAAELYDSLTSTDSVIIGEKSMKESSVTKMTAFSKLLKSISDAFLKMGVVVLAIGKLTDTGSWFRGIGGLVTMGLIVAGLMYATKWISDDSLGSDTVDTLKTKSRSFIGGKLFTKEGVSDSSFSASSDTAITRIRNMTKFISTISNAFIKMGVVCVALAKLTDFDGWGRAMISIVTFAALIAGIMLATKKIDADGFDKVSKSIFIISGALAVMAAAFIAISKLTWPELGKGIVGLIAFITLIAGAAVVTSITKTGDAIAKLSKSIMYLGIGMAAIAGSIYLFTLAWKTMETMKLDSNVLVKGVTAIFSALPGILKGLISGVVDMLISFIFDVITALTNRMTELMEAIGKFLTAFIKAVRGLSSEFSLDEVIEALAAIAIVFAMFMMLTLISKNAKGALKGLAMAAILIAGLTVVFSLLLNGNKGIGQDALGIGVGMAAIIAAVSTVALACSEAGKIATPAEALKGAVIMIIALGVVIAIIAIIGIVTSLIGQLIRDSGNLEDLKKNIRTAFEVINLILEEVGKAIGNFVGGIAEGLLPKLGTSLSIFMKNMGGFFEGAKKISKPSMEAVLTMAGAIAALLGGTLLNAASSAVTNPLAYISSWIGIDTTDMSPLVKMGKELTAFAPYIVTFANKITEIKDPKKAEETASSIGKIIDNLQKYLPWEVNAFWGAFTKKKINLSDFGKSMAGFLGDSNNEGGFIEFVNKMKTVAVPSELVTKAQNIGQMIKALQENLPWKIEAFWEFWGMAGSFNSQQTSLEDFGESMSGFASYFVSFANSISGVSDSAFNKGKLVADMVSTMATSMGQETTATGFLGFFSSKKESLTNFASDLNAATPNFKTFLESIDELTLPKDGTDKVDTLLKLITSFATFKEEGHTGWDTSWVQKVFIGTTGSLATFANELSDAIPGFTKLSKSIQDGEWSVVTDDQNKAVTSVVQLVGNMVKTLSNEDLKWDKLSDTAVTNMQAIREFLVGYFKLGNDAEYDNSHWEGPSDNPSAVGKKAYYTNTYVGGLLDIVIEMSKKLNSVDIPNSTVLSNASGMISKILEMLSEENFKVIKEITGLNSDYDFSNLYTLMNEYGDGLVAIMSAFSGYTLSPSYRTLTTDDVNRFKDLAGSIEEVFKAWDNIKSLVSTDEQGDLSVAVGKACGIIQSFIDKFAGLNYKISETNSTNFLEFVKTFVNDYANIDDKKLQRINAVNEAFKNVTGNALSAVMSEKTDYTKSKDVIDLTRHYNNIIINALNAVKSGLNADDPILNGVNLKSTYGFGNRFMAIISTGLNKKNNLLTNGILDSIKEAYNESAKHVRNPQETKDSVADHNFFKLGEYIALGISNGMKNKTSIVIETAKSLALDAYDASKKALEINSPSKLFMRLYSQIPEGAALGISNESRQVLNSIDTMTTTTFDRAKMAISKFPGFIDGSYSPTIAPVVDMSDFNSQYKSFSPLLSDTKVNVDAKTLRDLNDISSKLNYNNEQKILVDNSDVVDAVSNLDKRFTELEDYISGLTISLDSSKVVGGISKKMNNALGDDMYMQYRGV